MVRQHLIRNFSIISHIDHGKSTLADRFLEATGTIPKEKLHPQYLDRNPIERERGITIKLTPVRMNYTLNATPLVLNLIDTPGHVDFSYEVERALSCVEGAVLLVDGASGIQAQTVSHMRKAREVKLPVIPVVNKIDLPHTDPRKSANAMVDTFGFSEDEILFVSAKTGENVENLLLAIVERVPKPSGNVNAELKALIFDSQYDQFKGVICFIRVFDGKISKGDTIRLIGSGVTAKNVHVGVFLPDLEERDSLSAGEIGFVQTGLKEIEKARVGDTMTDAQHPLIVPIPGYREVKPMVFASFFPREDNNFSKLSSALAKLRLSDAAFTFEQEHSDGLGSGFRVGCLGLLHLDVLKERLQREYGLFLIVSTPTVRYLVEMTKGEKLFVSKPQSLPEPHLIKKVEEPYVLGWIIVPKEFLGGILTLLTQKRGNVSRREYEENQVFIEVALPFSEIITDFYDRLKNISSGFASFDYEFSGFHEVDVVRLDMFVSGKRVDALSQIVIAERVRSLGRSLSQRLKEVIARQQFKVAIQARVGAKVIARETIPAFRKDVTAKLYGGDRTRKDKLLEKQKRGKARLSMVGSVAIPQEAFFLTEQRRGESQ